ncbi:MAG: helix-turn-helix transcriptional regulator [Bacteroidota bacterium]|nr:helix-turn-helix transcriptional regulator [Bacteroidota bacterium]
MKTLSEKLKVFRASVGYDQEYMARMLKITQSNFSKLEQAPENISFKQWIEILNLLNINFTQLLSETEFEKYAPLHKADDKKTAEMFAIFAGQLENNRKESNQEFIDKTIKTSAKVLEEVYAKMFLEINELKTDIEILKHKKKVITELSKRSSDEILQLCDKFPEVKLYLKDKM